MNRTLSLFVLDIGFSISLSSMAAAQVPQPTTVLLDATQAPIGVLHAHFAFPASAGPMVISYPKWIPGEHAPTGPINQVVWMVFSANHQQLTWQRDSLEPFNFHIDVPVGASELEADLDFACEVGAGGFTPAICSSQNQLVLNWNLVLLYNPSTPTDSNLYQATLRLPKGWKYGTPLAVDKEDGSDIHFKTTPLKTLIDSPVLAGEPFQSVALGGDHPVTMDMIAETTQGLRITWNTSRPARIACPTRGWSILASC